MSLLIKENCKINSECPFDLEKEKFKNLLLLKNKEKSIQILWFVTSKKIDEETNVVYNPLKPIFIFNN
jgi:hypothetical protein